MSICRKGTTLAEILIVFTIIALVSFIGIIVTKPSDKGKHELYTRAYNALLTAAYNTYSENTDDISMDNADKLCTGLAKYMNAVPAEDPATVVLNNPYAGYCNKITGSRVTGETTGFGAWSKDSSSATDIKPDFVTNNAMRFFISNLLETPEITDLEGGKSKIQYYIIYVDLDGKDTGKNKVSSTKKRSADVVAFVLTRDADLIPLGKPYIDKSYLTVRAVYPQKTTSETKESLSAGTSYYGAVHKAWGDKYSIDDVRSINFHGFLKLSDALKINEYPNIEQDQKCKDEDDALTACDIRVQRYF